MHECWIFLVTSMYLPKAGSRPHSSPNPPVLNDLEQEALLRLFDLKSPRGPYRRELKVPIVRASKLELMLRGSPEEQERLGREEDSRIVAEQFGKLFLLLDHFQIPRTSHLRWFRLAFHLAREFVPGMGVIDAPISKRGPKGRRKGTPSDFDLLTAVTRVRLERSRGTADAIRTLRKRQPDLWGRYPAKSLQNRYSEIQTELRPLRSEDIIDNLKALFGSFARNGQPENSEN
jgi:hypothetical protein